MLSLSNENKSIGKRLVLATTWGGPVSEQVWVAGTVVLVAKPTVFIAIIDPEGALRLAIRYVSGTELGTLYPAAKADRFGVADAETTWQVLDEHLNRVARRDDWQRAMREVVFAEGLFTWIRGEIDADRVV